jgi:hypothetical protein
MRQASDALAPGQLRWTGRQARWFLIAMHVPYFTFITGMAATGLGFDSAPDSVLALPLVGAAAGLQLRHSLAASEGMRPRRW